MALSPLDSFNEDDLEDLRQSASRGAPALVVALFERNPHFSARELAAACVELGRPVSKSTAAVWRKRLAAGESITTPGQAEESDASAVENARERLNEAARSGNAKEAAQWATVLARLQGLPAEAPTDEGAGYDFGKLNDQEFLELERLLAKARGEGAAEAPTWPDPHPASQPLPPLADAAGLTPDGKAVVAVDGVIERATKRLERAGVRRKGPGLGVTRA